MKHSNKLESEVKGYVRSFPKTFTSAKGSIITAKDGIEYIDFLGGAGALSYGHNNPYFKEKLIEYIQKDGISHGLDMATDAKEAFMHAFQDIILKPRGLEYKFQFTGPTGTNAVEAAVKTAQLVTGRMNVVSFTNAYHGHTKGSLRLTANKAYREGFENDINQFTSFLPYYDYVEGLDSAAYLDKVLEDNGSGIDKPAAVILETIQGEGGVNIAPVEWIRKVREITEKHGVLMIVDDIQVGCGRTGKFFSFEESGIYPDIITLSKSLSGYGLPMSMVLFKPELDEWKPGQHTGTFRGNNLAFVTAREALERYWTDEKFGDKIMARGETLMSKLKEFQKAFPDEIVDVRGKGLIQAIEFKSGEVASAIGRTSFENGVIIETCGSGGNILKFLLPLTTETEIIERGLKVIEEALAEVLVDKVEK